MGNEEEKRDMGTGKNRREGPKKTEKIAEERATGDGENRRGR